jgi:RNA polymerase sigma-70 factor (ECF subfamily)
VAPAAQPARELLEGVRRREPAALESFYDSYFDMVYRFAVRMLGDRGLAEDAAQEVFLKIHRAADRLDSQRDPRPWVMTIVANVCRDVWRSAEHRLSRRSTSLDGPDDPGRALRDERADPDRELVLRERERSVQQALLALPAPMRELVLMHDYQGLGHEEIAQVLGIRHAAARKRYSRALAALGKLLQGQTP